MKDILIDMNRKHDFLICVDSDGCVFDNMELKHKECFCPATVNRWNLQSVSRYAREAAEFVNLYSTTRGANRFRQSSVRSSFWPNVRKPKPAVTNVPISRLSRSGSPPQRT